VTPITAQGLFQGSEAMEGAGDWSLQKEKEWKGWQAMAIPLALLQAPPETSITETAGCLQTKTIFCRDCKREAMANLLLR